MLCWGILKHRFHLNQVVASDRVSAKLFAAVGVSSSLPSSLSCKAASFNDSSIDDYAFRLEMPHKFLGDYCMYPLSCRSANFYGFVLEESPYRHTLICFMICQSWSHLKFEQ